MGNDQLRAGKLPPEFLAELLRRNTIRDPNVLVGPGVGLDVAVIDRGDTCLVAKTDPVTFATDAIGWYGVNVNANDIVTSGARPKWMMATVLLPEETTTRELVEQIYDDILAACAPMEIDLIGGHTEVTVGLDRPIFIGCMLGEVDKERLVRADGARPGDILLLTKRVAVEGTAIIGLECAEQLGDAAFAAHCARFLREPGISVYAEAMTACDIGGVHAMHDPTEGGLATGIREMAEAAGCGVRVDGDAIPYYDETCRICNTLGLDALGLIASGSLLLAVAPDRADAVRDAIIAVGVECAAIGTLAGEGEPCLYVSNDVEGDLPTYERDEIARLFSGV
jgi:hydrogenase expression/formation protein HypE